MQNHKIDIYGNINILSGVQLKHKMANPNWTKKQERIGQISFEKRKKKKKLKLDLVSIPIYKIAKKSTNFISYPSPKIGCISLTSYINILKLFNLAHQYSTH